MAGRIDCLVSDYSKGIDSADMSRLSSAADCWVKASEKVGEAKELLDPIKRKYRID